jgi:hypothetical protein
MFGPPISRLAIFSALAATCGLASTIGGLVLVELEQWHGGSGKLLMVGAIVGSVIGALAGFAAIRNVRKSNGLLAGEGLATGGLSLAAVGFIAFLVSTQFGAWADAKAADSREQCADNLKILHQAMEIYAQRNEGRLPDNANWCGAILGMAQELQQSPDYHGSMFQCPSSMESFESSYAFNAELGGRKLAGLPPDTVMLFEITGGWNITGGPESLLRSPRHNGAIACLVDGSIVGAESLTDERRWRAAR